VRWSGQARGDKRGDHIAITSRIVYRTVVVAGRPIPEAETNASLTVTNRRYWKVSDDKGRYAALSQFKDWGYLASLIRCDREYYDAEKRADGVQPCAPQTEK
jgi:hypothetical protein